MSDKEITGKTIVCGIIGDPVEHTMSPPMHNAAFKQLRLDYAYVPFNVKSSELHQAIEGMKAFNIRGLNVTIPHKTAVMSFLDEIDPLAEKIGAVNTIVNNKGILTGYNTDGLGFLQAIHNRDIEVEGKNVLVLGAGGAAKAVCFALAEDNANIIILNRKLELAWAQTLAKNIAQNYSVNVSADELNRDNLIQALNMTDITVNATSVGMSPNIDESPIDTDLLCANMVVLDVVYNPPQTRLLKEARAAGAITIGGIDMLVYQGAIAFEKWTGQKAPVDLMRETVLKLLSANEK
jgi:shikimate dehydrogenase